MQLEKCKLFQDGNQMARNVHILRYKTERVLLFITEWMERLSQMNLFIWETLIMEDPVN